MVETGLIFLCAVGFSAFGSIVGFGGGIFMLPVLIMIFHVPINIAVGSVIIGLLPGSLISSYFNAKNDKIDYTAGVILEIPTIIGTVLGAYLTSSIPLHFLELIFSFFVIAVGIYTFNKGKKEKGQSSLFLKLNEIGPAKQKTTARGSYKISYLLATIFGLMAGTLAGLFGIGGGFLKTPIMINVFNIPPSIAAGTALFMIIFTSLTGTISHYSLGHININYSLPIFFGFIVGAFLGNQFNLKISEMGLAQLIGIGLLLAGISLLLKAYF